MDGINNSSKGSNKKQISLLILAVFIDLFGFGIIIPILPFLATELGANGFQYGLVIALYSLMQFIFAPIWGRISDNVGRKPVILIGLGGSAIGFAIFGIATELWMIYLARSIAGIFTSATLTTANAYIADSTPPEERGAAFGLIAAAFGAGFALGPAVGGLMADYTLLGISGYALPSFFAALLSVLNMIGAFIYLPESLPESVREGIVKERNFFPILDTFKYLEYENVLLYILIFALSGLAFSSFVASFSIYAPKVDGSVDETALGIYFTYAGVILVVSQSFLIRPLLRKYNEETLVKVGVFLILIGFSTITLAPNFFWMFVTNTPLILGISFINPSLNSLISRNSPQQEQGTILGINQGWASLMRVFGPLIAGALFDYAIKLPFYFGTILFVLINFIAWRYVDSSLKFSGDSSKPVSLLE